MRVNIYIRKEYEAAWEDIANKSEFVNEAVRDFGELPLHLQKPKKAKRSPMTFCEHGAAKGFCKYSKCKHA